MWKHKRTDAFKLWCWRRLLRVPWTARRSNQWILKKIKLEYSLEGLMLKLKLQYFGHLTQRANSLEKTLMLGKIEAGGEGGSRGWDSWIASQLSGHEFEQTPGDSGTHSNLVCCSPWGHGVRRDLATEQQQDYSCSLTPKPLFWNSNLRR